jgi:hypothetical protein
MEKKTEDLEHFLQREEEGVFAKTESTQDSSTEILLKPNLPTMAPGSSFLEEWWLLFWVMFTKQRKTEGLEG